MTTLKLNLFSFLVPQKIPWQKIRFGRDYDGGYVVPEGITVDALLSYGIGDDISFEIDFAKKTGKPVYAFDPNIKVKCKNKLIHLKNEAITPEGNIQIHRAALNLEDVWIAVKMDIDGEEWDVLGNALLEKIAYMVIELHGFHSSPNKHTKMKAVLKKLNNKFVCAHVHANNYGDIVCNGEYYYPNVLEALFIYREKIANFVLIPDISEYPTVIDRPNNRNFPDVPCTWWQPNGKTLPNEKEVWPSIEIVPASVH